MTEDFIDEIEEIENMLKDKIGKDCTGIIMKMLFAKCYVCRYLEYTEFSIELYNKKWICLDCYNHKFYRNCKKCEKLFAKSEFNWCITCIGNCKLFCPIHLKDEYKLFFEYPIYEKK